MADTRQPLQSLIGSASMSDILTAAKNIVTAISQLGQNYINIQGAQGKSALTAATLLKTSAGRMVAVSVTTAGSTTGAVYDASATGVTTNPIFVIPMAIGVYEVGVPTNFGIVIVPGTGMTCTAVFS